mgnify:CR=1 FL=1
MTTTEGFLFSKAVLIVCWVLMGGGSLEGSACYDLACTFDSASPATLMLFFVPFFLSLGTVVLCIWIRRSATEIHEKEARWMAVGSFVTALLLAFLLIRIFPIHIDRVSRFILD